MQLYETAEVIINGQRRSRYTWHHDWMRQWRPDLSRSDVAHMHTHSDEQVVLCAAACYIESLPSGEMLNYAMIYDAENLAEIVLRAKDLREEFLDAPMERPVWADNEGDEQ